MISIDFLCPTAQKLQPEVIRVMGGRAEVEVALLSQAGSLGVHDLCATQHVVVLKIEESAYNVAKQKCD
jgi:hypothetical protein